MPYALQRFKSYGSKALSVGGQHVVTDFGLPRNAMVTAVGINVAATVANADAGTDYDVEVKEILSKISFTLACGAPVSATLFQGDGRAVKLAQEHAAGQLQPNPSPLTVAKSSSAAFSTTLLIPFFSGFSKRSKDFALPGVALESLTVSLTGHPNSQDSDLTFSAFSITPVVYFYEAEAISWGPVTRYRTISVSEDTRAYTGKILGVHSLPPLGKEGDDYPTCRVSADGAPQYDTTDGIDVLAALTISSGTSNPYSLDTTGTGEQTYKPTWLLSGGSILDVQHRTIELSYLTSLTTALGTSDTVLLSDLVTYARPDGSVKLADNGKDLRGSTENLPVVAA